MVGNPSVTPSCTFVGKGVFKPMFSRVKCMLDEAGAHKLFQTRPEIILVCYLKTIFGWLFRGFAE